MQTASYRELTAPLHDAWETDMMKVNPRVIGLWLCAMALSFSVSAHAGDILQDNGVEGGLVIVIGCESPDSLAELRANDAFLIHGLDAKSEVVAKAREALRDKGIYGPVSVDVFDGKSLPYSDNLANAIVVSRKGAKRQVTDEELQRVLAPRGVLIESGAVTFTKPVPADTDEWTHFRYSAAGNMVSQDERVGPPKVTQWVSGPIFQRHHGIEPSITATVTAGGRVYYILDDCPNGVVGMPGQWRIVARDAFNGVLLWKRDMTDWGSHSWSYWTESHAARFNHPLHVRKRLVADGDRLYVTLGFNSPVSALDAATGKTIREYRGTQYTDEFVFADGVLYLSVNDKEQKPWDGDGVKPELKGEKPEPNLKYIHAIDAASGKQLWKAGPYVGNAAKIDRMASMRHLNVTAGGGRVYLIDENHTIGLDAKSGNELWRIDRLIQPTAPSKTDPGSLYHLLAGENIHTIAYDAGRLFVLHLSTGAAMKHSTPAILQSLDPKTGDERWRYDKATPIAYIDWPDVFIVDDQVWVPERTGMTLIGLDADTGKVKTTHSIEKALNVGHHHRCYPNRASVNFAILGRRGAEFVDFKTGELTLHHWLRTACRSGHVLGNGLFYRPPDHCQCYMAFQPRGFFAMSTEDARASVTDDSPRLMKGSAFGKIAAAKTNASDWSTYRHDAMRSSLATCELPSAPKQTWKTKLGGTLTPPVVAEGKLFLASKDTHEVIALETGSGKRVWSFTAGGPVDSPPTIWQGHVVFGSFDGHVYCLRSTDGALVWRFRAAPVDRRIVAFGNVASAWPVNGSVLVSDGVAYCVAGRASTLDTGVYAYSLDVATGKLLDSERIHEIQTETKTSGLLPEGALGDILSTNGEGVFLGNRELNLTPVKNVAPASVAATRPRITAAGGFANSRWFHRAHMNYRSSVGNSSGHMIAFDETRAYVATASLPGGPNQTFYVPTGASINRVAGQDGRGPSWLANPNLQNGGAVLFAARSKRDEGRPDAPQPKGRAATAKSRKKADPAIWRHDHFQMYPWTMVVGGDLLAVAGSHGEIDQDDPWGIFEGRGGGELRILNPDTGDTVGQLSLDAQPIWNGMAAAGGNLFVAMEDRSVRCYTDGASRP